MGIFNSKLHVIFEKITNFFLLNIIWILFSFPIITIGPSTAAMFAVIREWKINGDSSVIRLFFYKFKDNFIQSFIIGLLNLTIVAIIYFDVYFILRIPFSIMKIFLLASLIFLIIISIFLGIYIYPIIVHYNIKLKNAIINACILSIRNIRTTSFLLCLITIVGFILYIQPLTIFVLISVTANTIFTSCYKVFNKV